MNRMTKNVGGVFVVENDDITECENGYSGNAVARLAAFEDAYLRLLQQQEEYGAEIETLRAAKKEKSVRFRELLGNKMMNANTLKLFEIYGVR